MVGGLAESAGNSTLAAFFDAVDSYLAGVEDQLLERAETFLATAAAELGFEGELLDISREQLTGSIENFFGQVAAAVDELQAQVAPPQPLPEEPAPPVDTVPASQLLQSKYDPVVDQLESLIADA